MMEKKRSVIFKIVCLVIVSAVYGCSVGKVNDEEVFKKILREGGAEEELLNFPEQFPNSKYADDALYLYLVSFAWKGGETNFTKLEEFNRKYSNEKLESSTFEYLKALYKKDIPYFFYIPHDLLLIYFKIDYAFEQRNYKGMIRYCNEFIEKFEYKNDEMKKILKDIYVKLTVIYKKLNKRAEYEKAKTEMLKLFPEEREKMEKLWPSPAQK